jgi:hypothetical protein
VAWILLEEKQQQELQVAGAQLAGRPEPVVPAATMAPVPAKEASAVAMSAPAAAPADAAALVVIMMIFMEKTHIHSFRLCHLTYRKI